MNETVLALRFLDVFHCIANGHDRLGRVVGNLDAELFLKRHYQLDRVERVGAEILDKGRALRDLLGIDVQMLDHDLLHAFGSIAHWVLKPLQVATAYDASGPRLGPSLVVSACGAGRLARW